MAHKHETPSLDESFDFSPELRKKLIISAIIGVAMVALGAFLIKNHWSIGCWSWF
jgi:vacuolar-type H+-ATPase subunit I/STV1